jgi:hypothetical protein
MADSMSNRLWDRHAFSVGAAAPDGAVHQPVVVHLKQITALRIPSPLAFTPGDAFACVLDDEPARSERAAERRQDAAQQCAGFVERTALRQQDRQVVRERGRLRVVAPEPRLADCERPAIVRFSARRGRPRAWCTAPRL